jgi:hypothetical protein
MVEGGGGNMVRFVAKNGWQKDVCYDEIRLHAQNMLTVLGSTIRTTRMAYVITSLSRTRVFTLTFHCFCPRLQF